MTVLVYMAEWAVPHTTNGPELVKIDGTNFPEMGYAFDAATKELVTVKGRLVGYTSGNLTLDIDWYSRAGNTTNDTIWGCQLACLASGLAASIETKSLAAANTSGASTVNGTAKGTKRISITISNLDSAAAESLFFLDIYRDAAAGGDTLAGDAIATLFTVSWA
jgi:hypothetical protein